MQQSTTRKCACCTEVTKCRHRNFNAQVWILLLYWGEIEESMIEQPICDSCYRDMRNLLIDRSEEMETLLQTGLTLEKAVAENRKSVAKKPVVVQEKMVTSKDIKKPRVKIPKAS